MLYCLIMIRFDEENRTVKKKNAEPYWRASIWEGVISSIPWRNWKDLPKQPVPRLSALWCRKQIGVNPATFMGKGKIEELALMCEIQALIRLYSTMNFLACR